MSRRYKCNICFVVMKEELLDEDGNCPLCHKPVTEMCPVGPVRCDHDMVEGVAFCDVCDAPMCPICGCHNVAQISRVTGYISDVGGWNESKRQELKDRVRYNKRI